MHGNGMGVVLNRPIDQMAIAFQIRIDLSHDSLHAGFVFRAGAINQGLANYWLGIGRCGLRRAGCCLHNRLKL